MKKTILTTIITLMAVALSAQAQNPFNGHEYVDLGLPSGTLWASMNIGAQKPECMGDMFAWGETNIKDEYTKENYKWWQQDSYTKYNVTDQLTTLEPEDDVAHLLWKGAWQIPTAAQFQELLDNTTQEKVTIDDVVGYKFKSKIDKASIFFPTSKVLDSNTSGYEYYILHGEYWSNEMSSLEESARCLSIEGSKIEGSDLEGWEVEPDLNYRVSSEERYKGICVRPVIDGKNIVTVSDIPKKWKVNGENASEGKVITTPGDKLTVTPVTKPGKIIKSIKLVPVEEE